MRTACALLLLAAAAALPAGAAVTPADREATAAKPSLRVVSWRPLKLRGLGFERRERVRVTAVADGNRFARQVRARIGGSFTVTFASATIVDRCGFTAFAVGASGSRASFKLPAPACPPQLAPGARP